MAEIVIEMAKILKCSTDNILVGNKKSDLYSVEICHLLSMVESEDVQKMIIEQVKAVVKYEKMIKYKK